MRIIRETNIDFMGKRFLWLSISAVLIVLSLVAIARNGIRKGVEFAGGAEVIVRYVQPPDLEVIRKKLKDAGFTGIAVTTFGETEGKEISIRVALDKKKEAQEGDAAPQAGRDLAQRIVESLRPPEVAEQVAQGKLDLNIADEVTIARRLQADAGLDEVTANDVAAAITAWRKEHQGVFESMDQVRQVPGVTEEAWAWLSEHAFIGPFALRGQEVIEASVSKEMRDKAYGAILGALGGMLIYIWIRFQFQYGLAAILALVHDTIITLGAFAFAGMEANLPVVAAFLTLVGYSVNDTIVVFDRIRENIAQKGEGKLTELINLSINQNLSRTLITSLTTWFVVAALLFLGGPVIRPFAFVLFVGIIVGTYSSIYIASPLLVAWRDFFRGKGKKAAARA